MVLRKQYIGLLLVVNTGIIIQFGYTDNLPAGSTRNIKYGISYRQMGLVCGSGNVGGKIVLFNNRTTTGFTVENSVVSGTATNNINWISIGY